MEPANVDEVVEIKIKVPWGHISGKWWGPQYNKPIIGLHGWLDNAGTFDRIAPLLPSHISLLAIDLPGHGLSSYLPDGMYYHTIDYMYVLILLMKEYNWEKISLLGHSMGGLVAFTFASLYPHKVDLLISFDALKPYIKQPQKVIPDTIKYWDNFVIADERNRSKHEPPSFTYEECIEKLFVGSSYSIYPKLCHILLKRNLQQSSKYPGKYFFTRDARLKYITKIVFPQENNLELAQKIKIPHLFIKAAFSSNYEDKKYSDEALKILKKNPQFHYYRVDGTHHVHINEPEKIAKIVSEFLNKYKPPSALSKL